MAGIGLVGTNLVSSYIEKMCFVTGGLEVSFSQERSGLLPRVPFVVTRWFILLL